MSLISVSPKLGRFCTPAVGAAEVETETESRRQLLEKMGRFSYVAPAMLLLIDPANAADDYKDKPPKDKPPKD